MIDLAYIVLTVLFFALMVLYVAGLQRLGRTASAETAADHEERRP